MKRQGWRRWLPPWRAVLAVLFLCTAAVFTMIYVAYAQTPTPKEPTVAGVNDQASIFYYRNGGEIGRIGKKRQSVELSAVTQTKPEKGKVPVSVQDAVLAAENRSFRTDPGFSVQGTARAAWDNLTGGRGGGSTITQQLAKNYYSNPNNRTYSRKFKELFIAVKLEQGRSKQDILKLYLNTISFGRDTYGIQTASKEYFNTDVWNLRQDQAAFLAGLIQNPNRDPAEKANQAWAKQRYEYVVNGLVSMGKLDAQKAAAYKANPPKPRAANSGQQLYGGQRGYMLMRAKEELRRRGVSATDVTTKGLRVYTTFDPEKMKAAKDAAEKTIPSVNPAKLAKKKIRVGIASVDSNNGEVLAIYGGPDYLKQSFDNVWFGSAQAGSAMKPYVLATALKQGYNLKSMVEGRSGSSFDGQGNVVPRGSGGAVGPIPNGHKVGPAVNLITATQDSINTAFIQLGLKVGLPQVVRTAESAGIAADMVEPYEKMAGLSLGINNIRPIEQAAGYQAFANGGTWHEPHVLRKVLEKDNKTEHIKLNPKSSQPWNKDVAADATYAMQQVVKAGTATAAQLPDGRDIAGKTGTTDRNVATWFVGYIPQMSTAVTMYNDASEKVGGQTLKKPLIIDGQEVQGGTIPAKIWRAYMIDATKGMDSKPFPPPSWKGDIKLWAHPPKPKEEKDKRPKWCDRLPNADLFPQCQKDGNGGDPNNPGNQQPCQAPGQQNCDPNKPPNPFNPPKWWCKDHRQFPTCNRGNGGNDGGTFPQSERSRPIVYARTDE
ncbi:penicillin-binding protein [Actinomadura barringtoniae]|uniref:Penicillin-binding protein n=1 Tax=Actinomadura barringtoniae TaxID=1427535 RepID=A0A939PIJ7_9ACTN|nr:transglycosylase domain-containing protein [Actinomadura barringtoniae]MBO2453552.1 penicillin-binding protein [Actinomadura barringtoniae]